MLNILEMAFRAYDPCFECTTHYAVGEVPMTVSIYDHNKNLVKVVKR